MTFMAAEKLFFFRFYKDSTTLGKFCQLAYLDDLAIGAICARVGM